MPDPRTDQCRADHPRVSRRSYADVGIAVQCSVLTAIANPPTNVISDSQLSSSRDFPIGKGITQKRVAPFTAWLSRSSLRPSCSHLLDGVSLHGASTGSVYLICIGSVPHSYCPSSSSQLKQSRPHSSQFSPWMGGGGHPRRHREPAPRAHSTKHRTTRSAFP